MILEISRESLIHNFATGMKQHIQWNELICQVSLDWNDNKFITTLIYDSYKQWSIQYESIAILALFYSSILLAIFLIQPNPCFWWKPLLSYTNECLIAMLFPDNRNKKVGMQNESACLILHQLIHWLDSFFGYLTFLIKDLFVILHLVTSIIRHQNPNRFKLVICTAFRPIQLHHSNWFDIWLLFLHYWVFIHCGDSLFTHFII